MKTIKLYKTTFLILSMLILGFGLQAQATISGTVTDKSGMTIIGANIFIEGSYDGGITDAEGNFEFTSSLEGTQTLTVSYLGYESKSIESDINEMSNIQIKLRESAQTLDAVEITASTFKAGDNSKVAVLTPLDIVTTAGSMGDVMASLQTLPGTQSSADDGRLFVRGGDARETSIYIDGLKVFSPYTRTIGGSPARGRYSPFLFKGVSFSTGGYSAQFGNALSGILDMNTIDVPDETETNISLMTIGAGVGHTQKWKNQSLSISTSYINLGPYLKLVPSKLKFEKPYETFSGEAVYRYQFEKGLLKFYVAGDKTGFKVNPTSLDTGQETKVDIDNRNIYANLSYKGTLTENTTVQTGISAGKNLDNLDVDDFSMRSGVDGIHTLLSFKTFVNDHFIIKYGSDLLLEQNSIDQTAGAFTIFNGKYDKLTLGNFVETDYFISKNLAFKVGLRGEYLEATKNYEVSPRFTLAQKLGSKGQVSAAYGIFRQAANGEHLFYDPSLPTERASHYLLNYNLKTDKQIVRLEAYYKSYNGLIRFDSNQGVNENYSSDGNGYAYGLDVFWRSNEIIKYSDIWVSYGWLKNKRFYNDYPVLANTPIGTEHNLSIVTKRWFPKMKSSASISYQFASGRHYENPNTEGFMNEKAKSFNNVSFSWAYLISQQKILFVSVSNFPGFKNEFGYRYASQPDDMGVYAGEKLTQNDDRFFFMGFFITMSKDKTKNQLDNL